MSIDILYHTCKNLAKRKKEKQKKHEKSIIFQRMKFQQVRPTRNILPLLFMVYVSKYMVMCWFYDTSTVSTFAESLYILSRMEAVNTHQFLLQLPLPFSSFSTSAAEHPSFRWNASWLTTSPCLAITNSAVVP